MNRRVSIILLPILMLAATAVHAGHLPAELRYPRGAEADADSADAGDAGSVAAAGSYLLTFDQKYSDGSLTSANGFLYAPDFETVSLEQSLRYELRRDRLGNMRQFLDASGELWYPLASRAWITPGLDWAPIARYSFDRGGRNALATLDMGPAVLIDAKGIPVRLRGGVSGRRVDSLAAFMRAGEHRADVGAYGAFRMGSEDETLPFAPVYFYADGLGRRIENSGMASLTASALGAVQTGGRDTLFVYGAASLFNGREGYLEESADSRAALFTETPWRIEQNYAFTAGYKIGAWEKLEPTVYYGVSQNVLVFPNDTRMRDETTLRQTLSAAVSTDTSAGAYYNGSVGFTWREHDKLFGRKDMPRTLTPDAADSLSINLWDHSAFDPRTAHQIAVKLPLSLRASYDISISRFLTEYPNYYVSGRDTVRNRDDNDRRLRQQRLSLEHRRDTTLRVELFGELSDYDLVYLRSAKSSGSRADKGQKTGINIEWSPTKTLSFSEALSAEAKRGEFRFPEFHQEALQRPRYSRAVNSSFTAAWRAMEPVGLLCKWDIKYSDFGFWYGRDYMQDALAADPYAKVDYYAITTKSVYTTVDIAAAFDSDRAAITAGGAFTVARDRDYSGGYYIISNADGYSVKPYVTAEMTIGDMAELSASVSRMFVIGNSNLSYWDVRLQAMAGF